MQLDMYCWIMILGSVIHQGWGRSLLGRTWADRLVLSCMEHVLRGGEEGWVFTGCLLQVNCSSSIQNLHTSAVFYVKDVHHSKL